MNARTRYNLPLIAPILGALLLGGCLPATRMPKPVAGTTARESIDRARASADGDRRAIVDAAEGWLGVPYVYGGASRDGVDCSGFVCNVYRAVRRTLPRTSAAMATVGQSVPAADALPGDLVFFNTSGAGVSHVGIMLESGAFIHASSSKGVIVSSLEEPYYRSHVLFVRRILE